MAEKILETPIEGLKIKLNKVVPDERGALCEMAPGGLVHEFFEKGVKNIYSSIATGKHIARAGHMHSKNIENFYTLTGTALWAFKDMRQGSTTEGKFFAFIVGYDSPESDSGLDSYTIDKSQFAQVIVPTGVLHIYWPLTDKQVTVVAVASQPYEAHDYQYVDWKTVPEMTDLAKRFGIPEK